MLSRFALPCFAVFAMRSSCHAASEIGAKGSAVFVCVSVHIWAVFGVSCCGLLPVIIPAGVVTVHVLSVAVIWASACLPFIFAALVSAFAMSAAGRVNFSIVAR